MKDPVENALDKTLPIITVIVVAGFLSLNFFARELTPVWEATKLQIANTYYDLFLSDETRTVRCIRNAMEKAGYYRPLTDEAWKIFYPQCKPWL